MTRVERRCDGEPARGGDLVIRLPHCLGRGPGDGVAECPVNDPLFASRFQSCQQRLGLSCRSGVSKPSVNQGVERGQESAGGFPLALLLPQATQAARRV
jgi:hypothetical protein